MISLLLPPLWEPWLEWHQQTPSKIGIIIACLERQNSVARQVTDTYILVPKVMTYNLAINSLFVPSSKLLALFSRCFTGWVRKSEFTRWCEEICLQPCKVISSCLAAYLLYKVHSYYALVFPGTRVALTYILSVVVSLGLILFLLFRFLLSELHPVMLYRSHNWFHVACNLIWLKPKQKMFVVYMINTVNIQDIWQCILEDDTQSLITCRVNYTYFQQTDQFLSCMHIYSHALVSFQLSW